MREEASSSVCDAGSFIFVALSLAFLLFPLFFTLLPF